MRLERSQADHRLDRRVAWNEVVERRIWEPAPRHVSGTEERAPEITPEVLPADALEMVTPLSFDALSYGIAPHLPPSLPPDLSARIAFLCMAGLGRLGRMVTVWPGRWLDGLEYHRQNRKQRRIFDRMDEHMLKDIGLSRCDLYHDLAQRQRRY